MSFGQESRESLGDAKENWRRDEKDGMDLCRRWF